MEYIAHRVNTLIELKKIPKEYGVELDLRDYGERLILQHDPFKDGDDFAIIAKFADWSFKDWIIPETAQQGIFILSFQSFVSFFGCIGYLAVIMITSMTLSRSSCIYFSCGAHINFLKII